MGDMGELIQRPRRPPTTWGDPLSSGDFLPRLGIREAFGGRNSDGDIPL